MTTQITLLTDINDENLAKVRRRQFTSPLGTYTQAVERTVKLITELSSQASSYEERHSRAFVTLISRNTMLSVRLWEVKRG